MTTSVISAALVTFEHCILSLSVAENVTPCSVSDALDSPVWIEHVIVVDEPFL
jgi:hypothetical protein